MVQHQIVCAIKSTNPRSSSPDATHGHITDVGTSNGQRWKVKEVIDAIERKDVFYTVSPTTQVRAAVAKYECGYCGLDTLRSHADGVWNNNLDNLPACVV